MPALAAAVDNARTSTAQRLTAARAARPGEAFTTNDGRTLHRAVTTRAPANNWAEDPTDHSRRNLGFRHPTTLMKLTTRCGTGAVDGLNEALLAKAVEAKVLRTNR